METAKKPVNIRKAPRRLFMGFKVRLLKDIANRGGIEFKAGEVVEIAGRWRGTFTLKRDRQTHREYIRGVYAGDFVVLEQPQI